MELIKKYLTNKTKIIQLRKEIISHEHKLETEIDFNKKKRIAKRHDVNWSEKTRTNYGKIK